MGTITEGFSNLTDVMLADFGASVPGVKRANLSHILLSRLLKPILPAAVRCGPGLIVDVKDRQVGPFDAVAASDLYPAMGEGPASVYPVDGAIFVLQIRDWSASDLTEFNRLAKDLKQLERKGRPPVFCAAVSFEALALEQVMELLQSQAGQSIDGIMTLNQHAVLRNSQGWYGNPEQVPFVSERSAPEALKSFAFLLLHLSHSFLGRPFGLADYQHL